MSQNRIAEVLKGHSYIPVVTFNEGDDPLNFVEFLIQQKVNCIEVTLRTPFAFEALEKIKKTYEDGFIIGAGTVVELEQVDKLNDLGIDFMVSPGLTESLIKKMSVSNIAFLPGISTPSEIIKARELGLTTLKFFPASIFGGIEALNTYAQVFPDINFCPTGGINKMSSDDYLKLPNVFAVGGSWFQKSYNTNREIK